MSMKIYAVRKGLTPGLYNTWDECKAQVSGFSGAEYKSFSSIDEAKAYLTGSDPVGATTGDLLSLPDDHAVAYVDGSFRSDTGEFAYGVVLFHRGRQLNFSDRSKDPSLAEMRNVAGEIKGAEFAIRYALDNGITDLSIFHDYEGISKWCTGEWKANKEGTMAYRDFFRSASSRVRISFNKVKGHSGDTYNDMADGLAKSALGIK